jgi:hypothetical protein
VCISCAPAKGLLGNPVTCNVWRLHQSSINVLLEQNIVVKLLMYSKEHQVLTDSRKHTRILKSRSEVTIYLPSCEQICTCSDELVRIFPRLRENCNIQHKQATSWQTRFLIRTRAGADCSLHYTSFKKLGFRG